MSAPSTPAFSSADGVHPTPPPPPHPIDENDRRIVSLDHLINWASFIRFVAGLTLVAYFVSVALLVTLTEDTASGVAHTFVGLGVAAFATCGALSALLGFATSVADTWRQAEQDRIRAT
jgi:hypothetical protein